MDDTAVEPIAIVGMACRVPGAGDLTEFWHNLVTGVRSRTDLRRDRLRAAGVPAAVLDDPAYVPAAYLLDDVETFDAGLFGLTAREAALIDPQHRVFLELCHSALEDAGWNPALFPGDIGVYGGRGMETYRWEHIYRNRAVAEVSDHMTVGIGNHADAFTTLVSYRLGLGGPSVGVYTACSTSLVAVHVAVEALRAGECDMALAGGVTVELPAERGYLHHDGGAESADGDCRPFDAAATGTVWGSGGGAVLLKRLSDAVADGDHIRAVVLGNAINNDGGDKLGFTAPSVAGQSAVIAGALAVAGVPARTVGYVEAHGTGTVLGDPMEVAALTAVFGRDSTDRQWCALGSVKSNVGHLSHGAGVVGLIKTALALRHGLIPPSLGYTSPNPAIDFAGGPFYVNTTPSRWDRDGTPRRAGVSSFGIGGTNAHVVLEEAPTVPVPAHTARPAHLLQLSARTVDALHSAVTRLTGHLSSQPDLDLADVAFTLRAGRATHPHRTAVVATDVVDAVAALRQPKRRLTGQAGPPPPVVFLFSGQGAQYAGMAGQLYVTEPAFATAVDECHNLLGRDVLFAPAAELDDTATAQPALFTVEYALAQLWRSWGVQPSTMVGHSIGEYVAATLAGVFPLADALALVALRGRLMGALPAGAMLAVSADPARFAADLPPEVAVAAVNGPGVCVVSGPTAAVEQVAAALAAGKVAHRRLRTSHAFHSPMMEPILADFTAAVTATPRYAPRLPFLSNRTGRPITAEQATDPGYWAGHLRETVRFGDCVAAVLADGPALLLECGPGRQLADLARMRLPRDVPAPLHSLPGPGGSGGDVATCYTAAGRLWTLGVELDTRACGGSGRRVPLPAYPYQRERHWIEPDPEPIAPAAPPSPQRRPLDEWFTVPGWRRLPPGRTTVSTVDPTMVVLTVDAGDALVAALRAAGTRVITVEPGTGYARVDRDRYTIRPDVPQDYTALHGELAGAAHWVHAWSLAPGSKADLGLFSLHHLVRTLFEVHLDVVTPVTRRVLDDDPVRPEHALLHGPILCAPHDRPGLRVRQVDTDGSAPTVLAAELRHPDGEPVVALRGRYRWAPEQVPVPVPAPADPLAGLRRGGVYLITGGLGAIGGILAEDLARRAQARLVLIGRSAPQAGPVQDRITAAGGEVVTMAADVTDPGALRRVRDELLARFGRLDGIVHAAGVGGAGTRATESRAGMLPTLAAKVTGTLGLRQVFGDLDLDFVVLFSSVAGSVGGPGETDYCAANAFLDAYADSDHGWRAPVRSLAWAGWQTAGPLAFPTWMTPAEGVAAFHRAIAGDLGGHVLIAPLPVRPLPVEQADPGPAPGSPPERPAPADPGAPDDDGTVAARMVGIWAAVLGSTSVSLDDDFFDLGGNSLVAVQLIAQVRKAFGVKLPMRSIFDASTVAAMAARVAELRDGAAR